MSLKRKNLSFAEKQKLIEEFKVSNVSKSAFAKEKGIARTTLNDILSSKSCYDDFNDKRKRMRVSPFSKIEEALVIWLKYARTQNAPISSLILKEKALQIATELGDKEFKASNGWIERFKERNCLSFKKICGEAAAVDPEIPEKWKKSILEGLLKKYQPGDIFNLDECGLFYRLLPDKTLAFKSETCTGGKKSKERLTVLLAANMDGTEKLTPLVIGKFMKPRCFKNIKSLPVIYNANSKAWMTSGIWEKIVKKYDQIFARKNRKVAFIVDNCPAHCNIANLKAIEIVFLAANTTSVLQPMDQGIIQNFKLNYRKFLLKDLIAAIDNKQEFYVSILDATFYIDRSWCSVSEKSIKNCFKHAGFIKKCDDENVDVSLTDEDEDDIPLAELAEMLRKRGCVIADENLYALVDDHLETTSPASISDIISQIDQAELPGEEEEEEEVVNALTALKTIRRYLASLEGIEESDFKKVMQVEKLIVSKRPTQKQTNITQYFNKN